MVKLYDSWRDVPGIPADWRPMDPPGAIEKFRLNNHGLYKLLKQTLPGRWRKVYHKGRDGTELHYCQHESGKVAFLKLKIK